jgi:hypothetical protein
MMEKISTITEKKLVNSGLVFRHQEKSMVLAAMNHVFSVFWRPLAGETLLTDDVPGHPHGHQ